MPKRNIRVKEEAQELRDDFLPLDIGKRPRGLRAFFTNNIFTRTLSHLVGRGPKKSELLTSNEYGNLLVCNQGSWLPSIQVENATLSDDNWHEHDLTLACYRLDLWIYSNDAKVKLYTNDHPNGITIVLKAESFYSIECPVSKVGFQNDTGGSNIGYQAVAYGRATAQLQSQDPALRDPERPPWG